MIGRRVILEVFVDVFWALSCTLALSFNFVALFISTVTTITGAPSAEFRMPSSSQR